MKREYVFARRFLDRGPWHLVNLPIPSPGYGVTNCGVLVKHYWESPFALEEDAAEVTREEGMFREHDFIAPFCDRCSRVYTAREP